jgi:histidinol-phosphatase (PHP family)
MYDYHSHSNLSSDGCDPIEDMVRSAAAAGLDEYAVTDHYDYDYRDDAIDFDLDVDVYWEALSSAARTASAYPPLKFVRGVEIGLQTGEAVSKNAELVSSHDFDFIIASVHCACDCAVDIRPYHKGRNPEDAARDYYDYTLKCLEVYDDFDVLGHINFIDRFTSRIPVEDEVWEHVDAVIKKLVDMGKGMEINTKIFRVLGFGHSTPTPRMLKRYVELGGETVTIGSDAHSAPEVGANLKEGEDLVRAAGLRYIATFDHRKPKYISI